MEIIISRILKYLNGCLIDDYMYRIGNFIVKHYTEICKYDLDKVLHEIPCSEEEFQSFFNHLGYCSYEELKEKLLSDHQIRMEQIQARMLGMDAYKFIEHLNIKSTKDEFISSIDNLCDLISIQQRIVIVGALYPSSIAVDFQTDMITLGKEVIEYHHFDKDFMFREDDIVIFITATGRTMEYNAKKMVKQGLCESNIVLVTQNIKYVNFENVCPDYVVHVLGKFDGLEFSYQAMMVLDLIRIRYYQRLYQ
ncbi:MAG: MurR/RpiR family transcriptional regulator [Coprobacillus sp.]